MINGLDSTGRDRPIKIHGRRHFLSSRSTAIEIEKTRVSVVNGLWIYQAERRQGQYTSPLLCMVVKGREGANNIYNR